MKVLRLDIHIGTYLRDLKYEVLMNNKVNIRGIAVGKVEYKGKVFNLKNRHIVDSVDYPLQRESENKDVYPDFFEMELQLTEDINSTIGSDVNLQDCVLLTEDNIRYKFIS